MKRGAFWNPRVLCFVVLPEVLVGVKERELHAIWSASLSELLPCATRKCFQATAWMLGSAFRPLLLRYPRFVVKPRTSVHFPGSDNAKGNDSADLR